jgi:hypothetical protein
MKMKFSFRDLLFLTTFVAVLLALHVHHLRIEGKHKTALQTANDAMAKGLGQLHQENGVLREQITTLTRDMSILKKGMTAEQLRGFRIEKKITEQIVLEEQLLNGTVDEALKARVEESIGRNE